MTEPANVRYLTGYVGSNGIAVIGVNGRFLFTDSRYAVSAVEQVRGAEVVIGTRDLLADVAASLPDVSGGGPIGVEAENLTLARHARLTELLDGLATEPTRGLVEELREIKDADEVAAMREAAAVVDRALGAGPRRRHRGAHGARGGVLPAGGDARRGRQRAELPDDRGLGPARRAAAPRARARTASRPARSWSSTWARSWTATART